MPSYVMAVDIEFPEIKTARRWYYSKEYLGIVNLPLESSRGCVFPIDGVAQPTGTKS